MMTLLILLMPLILPAFAAITLADYDAILPLRHILRYYAAYFIRYVSAFAAISCCFFAFSFILSG